MPDKRWQKLGESLVNYSLKVKPGEKLMIAMYEVESYDLAKAVYEECIKAGGYPQIQFMSESLKHSVLRYGSDEQISWVPEIESYGMDWADCYIALRGGFNMNECWDVPSEKIAKYQKAMGVVSAKRTNQTRWALVRVPNAAFAQTANIDYEKMMDMFFDACFLDWEKELVEWTRMCKIFDEGRHLRLVGEDTDLEFDFDDNKWVPFDNTVNIPDGELMITPKWETVKGHISYAGFPATLGGKVIHGLKFRFENGVCVEAQADNDLDYVNMILDSDEGSRRIGEFAIGVNYSLDVCTTDILIDEKIGGTVHTAMGRPYDGSYFSAIHWDIIKDTRKFGQIYIDDKLVFENGKILV